MEIEITGISIHKGVVTITANDVSDINLQRIERTRDDGSENSVDFIFDTKDEKTYIYLRKWLKRQKVTQGCKTWGEALHSVLGTITDISQKYRSWD